ADVAQGLTRAGFALRQRERIEEQRREVVVEAVGKPRFPSVLFRKEMWFEEFLRHRGRDTIAKAWRKAGENHRPIHVALMVGREDHRLVDACKMLAAFDTRPGEHARERQDPGRQAD